MLGNFTTKHQYYMQIALDQAIIADQQGEIPVGAVIANNEKIIAIARNEVEKLNNPLMHAEIIAINQACVNIGQKYLDQYNIYITLEPCLFCMNAILMSKIKKIFFATSRNKKYDFIENTQNLEIYEGILENQAKNLLHQLQSQPVILYNFKN